MSELSSGLDNWRWGWGGHGVNTHNINGLQWNTTYAQITSWHPLYLTQITSLHPLHLTWLTDQLHKTSLSVLKVNLISLKNLMRRMNSKHLSSNQTKTVQYAWNAWQQQNKSTYSHVVIRFMSHVWHLGGDSIQHARYVEVTSHKAEFTFAYQ